MLARLVCLLMQLVLQMSSRAILFSGEGDKRCETVVFVRMPIPAANSFRKALRCPFLKTPPPNPDAR